MNPVKYAVTTASDYAVGLLRKPSIYGIVHSVYRKTVNLALEGELLALQAAGSPLSPISLITNLTAGEINALALSPGASVLVQDHVILVNGTNGTCLFDLQTASIHNLGLSKDLSSEACTYLQKEIFHALSLRDAGSFELLFTDRARAESIPFLAAAQRRLSDADRLLQGCCWEDAAAVLCRLIGLGLGLTPGGDDFLCGVLAGLILAGYRAHPFALTLSAQIKGHLGDTNDISAAFLRCALQGQFSLAVNRLTALPSASEMLALFCKIGHSSGTDTLCGIYYALQCVRFLSPENF
ncbi:MAG: DUF2877 domain-containing protein [Lachnospiraceae bacterium]|nr:DUF2877 domain-containing protein [Lachnospiraceae bacterium]